MNIFLIGNGFDLHHKLPTAYIDFLHTLKFLIDHYDETTTDTVAKIFGDNRLKSKCKNISDSFDEYKLCYSQISVDKDEIKDLIEKAKNNMWFKYFSTAVENNLTWIDFEKEIARVVDCFNAFFKLIGKRILDEHEKIVFVLLNFSFFSEVDENNFIWDFFWSVDEIKPSYIKEYPLGSKIYEIDKEKIISELYSSLREFADMLKTYLKIFIDTLPTKMKELKYPIRNTSYPDMHCVFTFNYTNTIEKLYMIDANVYHIHGNVDDNIVLGVNPDKYDDIENVDTSFLRFKKYFQRVFYKTDVDYLEKISDFQEVPQFKNERVLYVIGHSLDETDKDIIQETFSIVAKIIIFYHKPEAVGNYIKNLVSIYGKEGLDLLRTNKKLEFLPHEPIETTHL